MQSRQWEERYFLSGFSKFKNRMGSGEDGKWSRHPLTRNTDENVEEHVPENRRILTAKFLICLELHVDQLRELWKITWMYMIASQFTTCLLIQEQKKNYFNMYQDHQPRLERKPEYLLKTVTGDVMTEQPKCHHSWSKTVRHTCWISNNALHKTLQTVALSLDCLYKLSGTLHWREQHSLATKCCCCYIFSPEAIWSLCICS